MIFDLYQRPIARAMLFCMAATLAFTYSVSALQAEDSWRELPMPSMYLQSWGRPDVKGSTWVVPQHSGVVGVSHDGGATILHHRVDSGRRHLTHAAVVDDNVAIVAGNGGVMFRTQDGGATWLPVAWNGSSAIRAMGATARGSVIVIGADNLLYRSDDGGATFLGGSSMFPSVIDHIACGVDGDTLYAYGRQSPGLLVSVDGGAVWERSIEPTADSPLDFCVGQDGTLALIDRSGSLWLRKGTATGWARQDSPWFTNSQWVRVSCSSATNMILMGDMGEHEGGWLQRFRYDSVLGWKSEIVTTDRPYLDTVELMSVSRGMLLITPSTVLLIRKLSYSDTSGYYSQKVNVMQGQVAQWGVHAIERTPKGTTLIAGNQRLESLLFGDDKNVQWIARHGEGGIDRELITHFVVDDSLDIVGQDEAYLHSSQSSFTSGYAAFVAKVANRLLSSADDGRTWQVSSSLPVAISSMSPRPISKYGDGGWMLGAMDANVTDTGGTLTMYTSVNRGKTWDQLALPISQSVLHASGSIPVFHYAPDGALGMTPQRDALGNPEYLYTGIDLQHGMTGVILERSPYYRWFMLGGNNVVRYQTLNPATVSAYAYVETYDILAVRKIGGLDRDVDAESGLSLSAEVASDSLALIHGVNNMIFLTTDAGRTWNEYELPTIDKDRKWDIVLIRRIRPGIFTALMRGRAVGTVERRLLVEFKLGWDHPVSVDTAFPVPEPPSLTVSPNPSRDGLVAVNIPEDMDGQYSWYVVDMLGRVVAEGIADTMTGRRITPGMSLSSGGYTLMLQSHAGRRTARFVVQP